MKPYYEDDSVKIYHGDNRDIIPMLDGINLIVTSPPYNQKINKFVPSGMHKESTWVDKISKGYFDDMSENEYLSNQTDFLNKCWDCLCNDGSLFYNHKIRWDNGDMKHPIDIVRTSKFKIRQEIIWARNGSCTLNAKMFAPSEERIFWLFKKRFKWNQSGMKMNVWNLNSKVFKDHPCVFPIEIPKNAIIATTDPVDIVLDPFMGSGTTLRAAKDLGRKAIGIEIEEKYCEIAAKRMSQEVLDFGGAS